MQHSSFHCCTERGHELSEARHLEKDLPGAVVVLGVHDGLEQRVPDGQLLVVVHHLHVHLPTHSQLRLCEISQVNNLSFEIGTKFRFNLGLI